jgi:hypothetical protein
MVFIFSSSMVSAEQRWNESQRAYNNAAQAYHQAWRARNNAVLHRTKNDAWTAQLARAQANLNRAQTNFAAATARSRNAYRNLTRKYHLPMSLPVEALNAVLMNLVRNEKARARQRGRARALTGMLPPNLASRIARMTS